MNRYLHLITIGLVFFSVSATAQTPKLYKWVDKQGNISYQSQPPPETATVLQESDLLLTQAPSETETADDAVPVVVYTIDDCDSCELLMVRLRQLGIPFSEQSILNNAIQQRLLSQNKPLSAPTMLVGEAVVSSFDNQSLRQALQVGGYLQEPSQTEIEDSQIKDSEIEIP